MSLEEKPKVTKTVKRVKKKESPEPSIKKESFVDKSKKKISKTSKTTVSEADSETEEKGETGSQLLTKSAKKRKILKKRLERKTKPKFFGEDVNQGCTIFIKNVPFAFDDTKLEEFFSKYGRVQFAMNVKDKSTGLSKGTAFVKFCKPAQCKRVVESANDPSKISEFTVDDRRLIITAAISKEQLTEKTKAPAVNENKFCDEGRNLHLAKIGIIRPGTPEAESLTKKDLTMREELLHMKKQKLKDPSIFISPLRICIRNLPKNLADGELKSLIIRLVDQKAKITECRIMRDRIAGGKSLQYGFAAFTEHSHALEALEKLNNNRELFKSNVPIVEFSLENIRALEVKKRRAEKAALLSKKTEELVNATTEQPTTSSANTKLQAKVLKALEKKKSIKNKLNLAGGQRQALPKRLGAKKRHKFRGPKSIASKPKDKISRKARRNMQRKQSS